MSESIYSLFETDKKLEQDGAWVDVGPSSFLLARAGGSNTRFQKAMSAALRPHQRRIALGTMDAEEANKLAAGPFVDTVLLGWKNVVLKDGSELAFTKENARKLLSDIPELFAVLMEESQRLSNFAPEDLEAAAKN